MKVFAIDLSVCNGCYCCQIACKDEHVANDWTPYAKPQPDTGQFWIGLTVSPHPSAGVLLIVTKPEQNAHPSLSMCSASVVVPNPALGVVRVSSQPR